MSTFIWKRSFVATAVWLLLCGIGLAQPSDLLRSTAEAGQAGGRLVVGQSSEPKTLNPLTAFDQPSLDVIRRMNADLIHINRFTQKTEPALAKSWTASSDGKVFTLKLRHGIRFSDGAPFDADDVLFSFQVYLDPKTNSPQRNLLLIGDQPIRVEKLDQYSLRFSFPSPYAAAERVFDSIPMLPRHLLETDYRDGKIGKSWTLDTPPDKIAGLGPFRLKQVVAGERVVLERNPNYWKVDARGQKLPYLDELVFLMVPSKDAQVVRFQAGETQAISPLSAENFAALHPAEQARHFKLFDIGPGLEYNFLLLNQNDDVQGRLPEVGRRQRWFRDPKFRQALSLAIDRAGIVRLVYQNRGTPLATLVTPGDKLWFNTAVGSPEHSLAKSRTLLQSAGFNWKPDGSLVDAQGNAVEFTILASASNAQRSQMATLIQEDLKQAGMNVHVVTMEFRSMVDRILNSHDYDAAIMAQLSGDTDPNPDMPFLTSKGPTHLWNLGEKNPEPWQKEIDQAMEKQLTTMDHRKRKQLYDHVQEILAAQNPVVFLASPNILAGAYDDLGNVRPAIMDNYILWNADELFWHTPAGKH